MKTSDELSTLELGVQPRLHKAESFGQTHTTLWTQHQQGQLPVLMVDDAHLLGESTLQELRLLTSFRVDSASPLALLLVGHHTLRDRLRLSI
ncbi:MAG: AAA family ATPase [Bacillota bacterium]